jgi:micrococcal nuclease
MDEHASLTYMSRVMRGGVLAVVLLLVCAGLASAQLVTRVVDGDTIVVAGIGTVRLIGVDTPETVDPRKPVEAFGRVAATFVTKIAQGKIVRLEYEGARKDRYDRTLAYVFLPDGRLLNAEIITEGVGHAYVESPFSKMEAFRQLERQARAGRRGLWASSAALSAADLQVVFVTEKGAAYRRDPAGPWYERATIRGR